MNAIELMDSKSSSFTKTDRAIYESVRRLPDRFATQSLTEISQHTDYSKSALTRFAQRLGYDGFVEFQYHFARSLQEAQERDGAPTSAESYGQLLKAVEEQVSSHVLGDLVKRMEACRHVYLMGYNLSRVPAEELDVALRFTPHILASYVQPDFPPRLCSEDMVIVYSAVSGGSYGAFMREVRNSAANKPFMVLVTTNFKHPLRRNFDQVIVLPTLSLSTASSVVLSDTFAFLMFNDMLTEASCAGHERHDKDAETDETN